MKKIKFLEQLVNLGKIEDQDKINYIYWTLGFKKEETDFGNTIDIRFKAIVDYPYVRFPVHDSVSTPGFEQMGDSINYEKMTKERLKEYLYDEIYGDLEKELHKLFIQVHDLDSNSDLFDINKSYLLDKIHNLKKMFNLETYKEETNWF